MRPDILIEQRIPPPPGQEHPYHTMFPDISRQTVEVVIDTVKTRGLWTLPQDQGFELLRSMYARFSQEYGMPTPRLHQDTYEFYMISAEDIGLPKVSLVSACHEYRHHMQKHGRKRFDDIEVDARAWSISLFHLALPEDFDRAWRRGKIWYMPPYPG